MLEKRFFDYISTEKKYAQHTLSAYENDLGQMATFFEQKDIRIFEITGAQRITHKLLRLWLLEMNQQEMAPKTIARKLATCRSYFKYLHREKLLDSNPAQHLHQPKLPKILPSFVKEGEMEQVLEQTPFEPNLEGARDRLILELLYGCGIRRAELLRLDWQDVDLYDQMITVTGKREKMRKIPFGKHVRRALQAYKSEVETIGFPTSGILIIRKNGKPAYPKMIYQIVKKYLQMASPHTLRHTYATHLLDNGADLLAIKELLGHSSLQATQVYTHNSIQKLKESHQKAHPRAEIYKSK